MPRQTTDSRYTGDADQPAAAPGPHGFDKGMEGGRQPGVVGSKGARHHVQISALCGVHTDADASVGNNHLRHPLLRKAQTSGLHDAVGIHHVGAVDPAPLCVPALRVGPGLQLLAATGHQRQPPAGLGVAPGQRLPDAAGGAGDENQGRCDGTHGRGANWALT